MTGVCAACRVDNPSRDHWYRGVVAAAMAPLFFTAERAAPQGLARETVPPMDTCADTQVSGRIRTDPD